MPLSPKRLALLPLLLLYSVVASAGITSLPHFLEAEQYAVTLEPDLVLATNNTGAGVNVKYAHGMGELMDGQVIVGSGQGPRRFRLGGNLDFDFIPDIEGQPGMGIATQALYVVRPDQGRMELTGIPYIHKSFPQKEGQSIEPFFAFPIGAALDNGSYYSIATGVVGALIQESEHWTASLELGVNVVRTATYISAGIVYTH